MRILSKFVTPVLVATAAAIALVAAPTATADEQSGTKQWCVTSGTSRKCEEPGDVEINSSIPVPPSGPWSIYGPFWGG
jgi:hypothetical protein